MLNPLVNIYINKPGENKYVKLNTLTNITWETSVKNLERKIEIKLPLRNISFDGTTLSYGDSEINLYDFVDITITYDGYENDSNLLPNIINGYITKFNLTKTDVNIEVEGLSYLLKQMTKVKFSKQDATIFDLLKLMSGESSTTEDEINNIFTIDLEDDKIITIHYENYQFQGNFLLKDKLSPFEILNILKEEYNIKIYQVDDIIYIGKTPDVESVINFSYPYIYNEINENNYNFVIGVNIEQNTIDLNDYIVKGTSVKSATEILKYAYDINGEADYDTEKDNTMTLKYPSVDLNTLKKFVEDAWEKLVNEKNKQGSFTTFGIPNVNLDNNILLNLYGDENTYTIDSVIFNMDVSNGIKQTINLGKKIS